MPKIQRVRLSSGEARLTWPAKMTELQGLDISADATQIGLGTEDTPPTSGIITPPVVTPLSLTMQQYTDSGGTNPFKLAPLTVVHQLAVQMWIGGVGALPAAGSYWVWARLSDLSEIEWFQFQKVIVT